MRVEKERVESREGVRVEKVEKGCEWGRRASRGGVRVERVEKECE